MKQRTFNDLEGAEEVIFEKCVCGGSLATHESPDGSGMLKCVSCERKWYIVGKESWRRDMNGSR